METEDIVRMTYSYKKKGRQISAVSAESIINSDMCRPEIGATHVVTELKYGLVWPYLFQTRSTFLQLSAVNLEFIKLVV